MSIENPKFDQGPEENPSEMVEEALRKLKEAKNLASPELRKEIEKIEILEGVGVESVQEVEDILGGIEASLEADPENKELLDQKTYFAEVLKQINELK